ncbi:hypothetical protein [Parafrankia sp. CH37]|uniref:hypothetical protein n=1 Tax=Parafrankia sp. CH37 TaxID=683308 RepID=UPI0018689BC8|nr:hypothetical protein [Parafrankia sp. CH37]MBE3202276.1 hypothetical protein [Parafrankia sp. CH37]
MAIAGKIEDILQNVLGYTLGSGSGATLSLAGSPGASSTTSSTAAPSTAGGSVDAGLRPDTVRATGPAWLIPDERVEGYHAGGSWKPGFHKNALTFWRWMEGDNNTHAEYLTVWVGARDPSAGGERNSTTADTASNALLDVGKAWKAVSETLPNLAGPGTHFDPDTLGEVGLALKGIGEWAGAVFADLDNDIARIDTKKDNFAGSAAEAFRNRVLAAQAGLTDVLDQSKTWLTPISDAVGSAAAFVHQLDLDRKYWMGENVGDGRPPIGGPPKVWVQPWDLIVALFNNSQVYETWDPGGYSLEGNRNHSGGLWETGRIRGGEGYLHGWREMYIRFPEWSGLTTEYAVLRQPSWIAADIDVRKAWADRVQSSFKPSLDKAQDMVAKFAAAQTAVRLGRMPPPRPPRPPKTTELAGGLGNQDLDKYLDSLEEEINKALKDLNDRINLVAGGANENATKIYDDLNKLKEEINKELSGITGKYNDSLDDVNKNINDQVKNLNNGVNKELDKLYENLGASGANNGLGGLGGPGGGGTGGGYELLPMPQNLCGGSGSTNGLGDLSGLGGTGAGGTGGGYELLPMPPIAGVTSGLGSSGLSDLGDLNTQQLGALQQAGLLSGTRLTPAQSAALREAGLDTDATTLGELSPAQLKELQARGLLDDVPLTSSGLEALGVSGLLDPSPATLNNLGDLSPAQLTQLGSSGLLDNVPITADQLGQLRADGLLGPTSQGIGTLGDLNPTQLQALNDAGLLDSVPLSQQQLGALQQSGLVQSGQGLAGAQTPFVSQSGVTSGLNGLNVPDLSAPTSAFPTQIDGLDVTTPTFDSGVNVGDIRQPLFQTLPDASTSGFGVTSGFGTNGVDLGDASALVPSIPHGDVAGLASGASFGTSGLGTSGLGSSGLASSGLGGTGLGSSLAASGVAALDAVGGTAPASATGGGMPFMPMGMGGAGAGAGAGGRDRQRNTWLTEDEEVWGTDPECAPAVVGREATPAEEGTGRTTSAPAPAAPGRDRIRRGR